MKTARFTCLLAVVLGLTASTTWAAVESFEGTSAGPNMGTGLGGWLVPGEIGPFTFASGVTLTSPIPNPGQYAGVLVGDWSIGDCSFGLTDYGTVWAADVPAGSAFMGLDTFGGPIEFTFASDVLSVGAFVTSAGGDITLTAFDSLGNSLGTAAVAPVYVTEWDSNWLGFSSLAGIRKVQFDGYYMVLDDLTFGGVASVPAPGAVVLGMLGTGLVGWLRKRRTL